jgi:hypothetical protein
MDELVDDESSNDRVTDLLERLTDMGCALSFSLALSAPTVIIRKGSIRSRQTAVSLSTCTNDTARV